MTITGLGGAIIWTEDISRLLPFYRDVLGLTPGVQRMPAGATEPDFVLFGDQTSAALAIGTHSEVRGRNQDAARHMVGLTSDDIEGDVARLKGAGVTFVEEPTDYDGLVIATLEDPDGNLVQLYQFR